MKTYIYANLIRNDIYCHCFSKICHPTTIRSFHILESSLGEAFLPNGDDDSSRQPKDQKLNDRLPINNENLNSNDFEIILNMISKSKLLELQIPFQYDCAMQNDSEQTKDQDYPP